MSDKENPIPESVEEADPEVLEELMEKDAKSGRTLSRFWY